MAVDRTSGIHGDTVDLHGTTVAEAIAIVQEMLLENPSSNGESQRSLALQYINHIFTGHTLKIITGKGTHSHGKSSVLKPAIKNTLVEQGWDVSLFDGGLLVRGRS